MRRSWLAAASAAALLSACGDGGSGGGSISGGGTTSGGTPTPSPAPSPTYTAFASLTGNQSFASSCSAISFQTSPVSTVFASPFGAGLNIGYSSSTQTYTVTGDGNSLTFGPADLTTGTSTGPAQYSKAGAFGTPDRLTVSGSSLTYARTIVVGTRKAGGSINYFCVIGVPTVATDVPPLATYTFSPILIGGSLYDLSTGTLLSYSLFPTTVTFSVDLTTQKVTATMHLVGQDAAGVQTDFGTYTGTGTVDASTGLITGNWSSTAREVAGTFGGTFFGPQGKEVALSYNIQSRPAGSGQFATLSAGYFYGAR